MSKLSNSHLDVVSRLVENYRNDKPLLDGAVLFRGSRFGDQTPAKDSPTELHGHLLPQIAAGYTHSWTKAQAFIDTYPVDRDRTRFFASPSLDEYLKGNQAKSYSVEDVERAIRPLVENLAYLPRTSKAWSSNVESLEKVIKASFYEAAVPIRTAEGSRTQPAEKFFYSGSPKATTADEVISNLEKLTPQNEVRAKAIFAMHRPTETAKSIAQVASVHPEAAKAFRVLQQAVQRDHAKEVLATHGARPLTDFVDAVRQTPQNEAQSRILRLAQGLGQSLDSLDPNIRARALSVTSKIAGLDPNSASIRDIGQVVARVNSTTREPSSSAQGAPAHIQRVSSAGTGAQILGR